ncbi:MAG TPA: type II toxin-antitoxin system VapC family toxin [Pyrinomonadaceae bacterium]|nr:type II toxin-antitoxin system VapC family toxin [Pyrinomonadaceae bacterium]
MSERVIDSSAILAVILQEKGGEIAKPLLQGAKASSVNIAEVLSKLVEMGLPIAGVTSEIGKLDLDVIDFDIEQARKAAELRLPTKHLGLSLGDRCCLALAMLLNATAITADRQWKKIKVCPVELVR